MPNAAPPAESASHPATGHKDMPPRTRPRAFWLALLAAIITAGLLSRTAHTGSRLFDKYLGDALYAAMVYVLFRLTGRIESVTLWTVAAMTTIELFQLTQIPAGMVRSAHLAIRLGGRLLGTEFSVLDLLAYAAGIACIAAVDRTKPPGRRQQERRL